MNTEKFMEVKAFCENYFNAFSNAFNENISSDERFLAKVCFASYFIVLPPVIFGIGYLLSCIGEYVFDLKSRISQDLSGLDVAPKTNEAASRVFMEYPKVNGNLKQGFFVDVLNKNGYSINGKDVIIPPAGKAEKFSHSTKSFAQALDRLKKEHQINDQVKIDYQFKDRSTEEAISESKSAIIALNFANEHHAGGGPGFHKDPKSKLFVFDKPSAKAQEESLCQRSNLLDSLLQLPHTLKAGPGSNFYRSYYDDEFDSKKMAYVSDNHLFATQDYKEFYLSHYLNEPKAVMFITSAAKYYGNREIDDFSKSSDVYKDAKLRIETHLLASAYKAGVSKMKSPNQSVELILGAFGCGAFIPKTNHDEYRKMIANIYKELLPEFKGFFDVVTFAVPTFGNTNRSNAAVANHHTFKRELNF